MKEEKVVDPCQIEINQLWDNFEKEKRRIMNEEFDKDIDEYYPFHDGIYIDNYSDHWRVEELVEETYQKEDKIIEKHHPILEEAG